MTPFTLHTWQTRPIFGRGSVLRALAHASAADSSARIDSHVILHPSSAAQNTPKHSARTIQANVLRGRSSRGAIDVVAVFGYLGSRCTLLYSLGQPKWIFCVFLGGLSPFHVPVRGGVLITTRLRRLNARPECRARWERRITRQTGGLDSWRGHGRLGGDN